LTGAPAIPVESLARYFSGQLGETATVKAATVASEGASDDTWMLEVETAAGPQDLVVRRYRPGGAVREETDPERHFRILRELGGEQVPAPEALWFEPGPEVAGGPFFVMRRAHGRIVVPWLAEGRAFLAAAGEGPLGGRFVAILAAIHAVRWRGGGLEFLAGADPGRPQADAARRVERMRSMLERYRCEPEPILLDALAWLERNLPEQERTTLVHGDYRTGNVVFGERDISAVLDWEFARIGDPASDLAWVLSPSNRMGSELACYLLPPERVLEIYEREAGWAPSAESLRFWDLLHLVFNAVLWISAEHNYRSGATTDIGLARWSYTVPRLRGMVLDALEER